MPNIPSLSQTRVVPLTRIRRERLLPGGGDVVTTVGSRVDPLDVVARSEKEGHLRPIPLARYMQLSESALPKYMLKKPGDSVTAREIIASKPELLGTLRRIYRAPGAGRVASLQGTWLAIEIADPPIEVRALYRGTIANVMPGQGVVVEAMGSLAQGVWGSGGEGYGVLKKAVDTPDQVLSEDRVDVSARGAIVLAGAGVTEKALERAVQEHVAGMVVGGLDANLRAVVAKLGLAIMVTEGFGQHAMAAPIFELLASHHGEEACLNASVRMRSGTARPEVFVPAISTLGTPLEAEPLTALVAEIGAAVRILRGEHADEIGKLADVPAFPQTLESGVSVWGADIDLPGEERVFVPWPNLELIG